MNIMRLINGLRSNDDGLMERCSILVELDADDMHVVTLYGEREPVNKSHTEQILGWGKIDGPAYRHGSLLIPASF